MTLATVLLLLAISQRFKTRGVRLGLLVVAVLLLCFPIYRIFMLPRAVRCPRLLRCERGFSRVPVLSPISPVNSASAVSTAYRSSGVRIQIQA